MVDVASPPRYTRYSRAGPAPASDLPAYSRRNTLAAPLQPPREPTEHVFQLSGAGSSGSWATLKVFSSAKSTRSLPTYYEKEKINGCIELNLGRGESVSSITAKITGRVITGPYEDCNVTFLDITTPIWDKSSGASSRTPSPTDRSNKISSGRHSLPFSIALPRTIEIVGKSGEARSCSLPETFLEKHGAAAIQYDITVTISRGKLKPDSHIKTAFGYVPSSRPDAPSILRQFSYSHNLPLSGPDADPSGWHICERIKVQSMMKTSPLDIDCLFALPNPLCYTRGSAIPCMLSLEGNNTAALDTLCAPGSIVVSLKRRITYNTRRTNEKETVEDVGTASWWSSASTQSTSRRRFMEGEIKLNRDIKSSSDIGSFSVSYFVVLSPFASLGITPYDPKPLAVVPVSIATMHAKGPRPQIYAPPAYNTSANTQSKATFWDQPQCPALNQVPFLFQD